MKAIYIFCIILGMISIANAKESRIKIGVIDTGININERFSPYICENGVISYNNSTEDKESHGTQVSSIIVEHLNPLTHCLFVAKWYTSPSDNSLSFVVEALNTFIREGIKYVNISMQSGEPVLKEKMALYSLLRRNVYITISAGNAHVDLDKQCTEFPACYFKDFKHSHLRVVASVDARGNKTHYTNYNGPVTDYIYPDFYKDAYTTRYGTSFSAPHLLNTIIRDDYEKTSNVKESGR